MTPTQAGPEGSFLSGPRKEMKILQDLDQRSQNVELDHTGVFPLKATCGHSQCLSRLNFSRSLVKYANTRKEIKSCLAFPSGPVNRPNEDSSCYTVKKWAPVGPGTAPSSRNVFTQHSACSSRFARSPPLLSAPGKALGCCSAPHPSWTIRTDRQSGCVEMPPSSGLSLLLTGRSLSAGGVGWDRGAPAERVSILYAPPVLAASSAV